MRRVIAADRPALEKWIDPRHLSGEAMDAVAHALDQAPLMTAVIDDFLRVEQLERLQSLFRVDGSFEEKYALFTSQRVARNVFETVSDDQRFLTHLELVGSKPGRELSPGVVADLLFRRFLADEGKRWFEALTGEALSRSSSVNAKILTDSHFLRPHSDSAPGRRVCCVLYVSDGWRDAFGGVFELFHRDRRVRVVEPIANRLIVFRPHGECLHAVAPIGVGGADWQRWNYSFWYKDAALAE